MPETYRWSVLGKHRSRRLVTLFPRRRSLHLLRLLPSPPVSSSPASIPLPLVSSVSKLRRENDASAAAAAHARSLALSLFLREAFGPLSKRQTAELVSARSFPRSNQTLLCSGFYLQLAHHHHHHPYPQKYRTPQTGEQRRVAARGGRRNEAAPRDRKLSLPSLPQ